MIRYLPRYTQYCDCDRIDEIAREAGISRLTAGILCDRGLDTPGKIREFYAPDRKSFHNPFLMKDMDKAVRLLREAFDKQEKITIYGDYDTDGVTATAILLTYLQTVGAQADYYLPSRQSDGYGLHKSALDDIAASGTKLLITVDCGISNIAEIAYARSLGLKVIVTDHHEPQEVLPEAEAVVNPKCSPDYPFDSLCGAGVALKLVQAMGDQAVADAALDLAALGTVADLVHLQGENRAIVTMGLRVMNENLRCGIRALVDVSGLTGQSLSAGHLGFQLGPRINAGGRMDSSMKSVEMLVTEDYDSAYAIAMDLDANNSERRRVEQEMLEDAEKMLDESCCLCDRRGIVLWNRSWAPGVLGIVASRLQERFHRPVVLLGGAEGGETFYGSARSVPDLNLVELLRVCSEHLLRFGGHAQAAGMEVADEEEAARFARDLEDALESYPEELFLPYHYYDAQTDLSEITPQLVEEIDAMAPMGVGNPTPVLWVKDAEIQVLRTMGEQNQHFSARITSGDAMVDAVAFRQTPPRPIPGIHGKYDILCVPALNEWRGHQTLQCQIKAWYTRKTTADAENYLRRANDDFLGALWTRYWMSGSGEDKSIDADWQEDILDTAIYILRESAFGTLIVAGTPAMAQRVLRHPLMEGICEEGLFILPGEEMPEPGMSCIAVGRSFRELKLSHYRRVILLDGLVSAKETGFLYSRFCQGDGEVIVGSEEKAVSHIMYMPNLDIEWFRDAYRSLRRATQEGYTGNGGVGHGEWFARILNQPRWMARVALMTFRELGLLEYVSWTELKLTPAGRPLNLEESVTYRKLHGLEPEPGMPF